MPATLTTVNAILKEVYEDQIRDQLQSETVGFKRIERTSEGVTNEVGGKYVTFPVRTKRNAGVGARNEMEALPSPGQQGYQAARVSLKYQYGAVQLTGQTIELADSNFQAFASALDQEIEGLKSDLAKDQNRQFYGTNTGILANITADGSNTVTVTSTQYLEVGQFIDVVDGTTLANATPTVKFGSRTITLITGSVVTYDGADGTAVSGDKIVRQGDANRELTGLAQIVAASGTLYNINPATDQYWVSTVDSNSGVNRSLSEGLMIANVDNARRQGGKTSVIFTNLGVRRAYFNLLTQQRRFTDTKEFDGGFSGLAFSTDRGDVPVVVDMDCPFNTMYFLDEKQLKLYRESEWTWMNRDGSQWQRVITSSGSFDAYAATLFMYEELGTHKRNAHAVMQDITEG